MPVLMDVYVKDDKCSVNVLITTYFSNYKYLWLEPDETTNS